MTEKRRGFRTEIKRINGYLKEVVTLLDESGEPVSKIINPLMVELRPRDVLQLFVGSFLIAAPLCFTEEVWKLSEELNQTKILLFALLSFVTVVSYIYLNFYRYKLKGNIVNFIKRLIATYVISISSVVLLLFLIDKLPLNTWHGVNRIVIIGFPSMFGAILSDSLK
jgi:uncharacterized membrane protein